MHTAIGTFDSRESAEEAYRTLLMRYVPPQEILYLTRSHCEAAAPSKDLSATLGGLMGAATGMTAGVGAAVLLAIPGVGQVIAVGFGAAALLGLAGASAGSTLHKAGDDDRSVRPTPHERCRDDVEFFRQVLAEGHSLIVVRTESHEVANVANRVLSHRGAKSEDGALTQLRATRRQLGDIAIVDLSGRITLGEGNAALRQQVREILEQGHKKILLNLREVGYIDSSGLGEIVKSYTTVRSQGGQLKLVQVNRRVHDLLQTTKLHLVLEIEPDEETALQSFGSSRATQGTA